MNRQFQHLVSKNSIFLPGAYGYNYLLYEISASVLFLLLNAFDKTFSHNELATSSAQFDIGKFIHKHKMWLRKLDSLSVDDNKVISIFKGLLISCFLVNCRYLTKKNNIFNAVIKSSIIMLNHNLLDNSELLEGPTSGKCLAISDKN